MPILLLIEASVILLFSLVELAAKSRKPIHAIMAVGTLGLGYILLYAWSVETGLILAFPSLLGSDIPVVFLTIPAFYLASLTILREGEGPAGGYIPYFAVPGLAALASAIYMAIAMPGRSVGQAPNSSYFADGPLGLLRLSLGILMLVTILLDLAEARRLWRARLVRETREFRGQVRYLLCYLAPALLVLLAASLRREGLYVLGYALFGLIALVFVFSHLAVSYFARLDGVSRPPVEVNPAWDRGARELSERLARLMETEAPYRDPDLRLGELAKLAGIEPKRLSYHLRRHHALGFRGYINTLRLEAVCRDFRKRPGLSILDAALENGFNSKSSFNTLFHEKYGMTPREYKNSLGAEGRQG